MLDLHVIILGLNKNFIICTTTTTATTTTTTTVQGSYFSNLIESDNLPSCSA